MNATTSLQRQGFEARRYEYDDDTVIAADLGPEREATVEVVDGTLIVVTDDDQFDVDLPSRDAQAFMRNGVLTIEVNG
jgi:hypothetical protein